MKFAHGGSLQTGPTSQGVVDDSLQAQRPFQLKSQMSRTHFLSASRNEHHSELTLSLPSMGPNFNFYKFKGISEAYQSKFRATQRNLSQVNTVLAKQWGQQIKNYNRFGMHLRSHDADGNLLDGDDGHIFMQRPVPVDNKGISPLTTSPRGDQIGSKEAFDYPGVGPIGLPLAAKNNQNVADAQRASQSPGVQPADEHYGGTTNEQIYSQWGISQQPTEQIQVQRDGENVSGDPRGQRDDSMERKRAKHGGGQAGQAPKFIKELEKQRRTIKKEAM